MLTFLVVSATPIFCDFLSFGASQTTVSVSIGSVTAKRHAPNNGSPLATQAHRFVGRSGALVQMSSSVSAASFRFSSSEFLAWALSASFGGHWPRSLP